MAVIRPFQCVRPEKSKAARVAALPYDVYNRQEAKEEVLREPMSFLKIDRAETSFDDSVDTYTPEVYQKAKELLEKDIADDVYIKTGPIFLAYRSEKVIDEIVEKKQKEEPIYDFTAVDGITHRVWKIAEAEDVEKLGKAFADIENIYIADGHHRAASAVKVGLKRRKENPGYTGDEEFNYFLSVLFPHDQLMIMDYNRTVKDLNGLSKDEFLKKVAECFEVKEEDDAVRPQKKGEGGMYLDKQWYRLIAKPELFEGKDAVGSLDVSVLQDYLLGPVLGIGDPRTDSRIDFIGGIRGLKELERRADNDMKVSFSMYPTSITELFDVADQKLLMPPKSTWFEPKLRSGLFIHEI